MASPRVLGGGEEGARRGPGERPGEGKEGGQEGGKNVYPSSKSASKTRTLTLKVRFEASKTCTLRQKVHQKHVPLGKKSAPVRLRDGNEPLKDPPLSLE